LLPGHSPAFPTVKLIQGRRQEKARNLDTVIPAQAGIQNR